MEGRCYKDGTYQPTPGLQLQLGPLPGATEVDGEPAVVQDTLVMANLGYFQLKANPGTFLSNLKILMSCRYLTYADDHLYSHTHTHTHTHTPHTRISFTMDVIVTHCRHTSTFSFVRTVGVWQLALRAGRSLDIYDFKTVDDEEVAPGTMPYVVLNSFTGANVR